MKYEKGNSMPTKYTPFDLDFASQYQPLKKHKQDIQNQIDALAVENTITNVQKINKLLPQKEKYTDAIIKLLRKETKRYCEPYAKQMFDISVNIVVNHLFNEAIKFDMLSINDKLKFGQTFINHLAKRLEIAPNKLIFSDVLPANNGAEYKFDTHNININKNNIINAKLQYFIGEILHEYTHHLYNKHPELTPLGEQKIAAIMENFIQDATDINVDEYKQRPFEMLAYYVQEYFEKYKFVEQVLAQKNIKNIKSLKEFAN